MPLLENSRHERFAQEVAAGKSASDAYQAAGYEAQGASSRANASRLLTNANIAERVAELQGRAAEGVVLTRQWVIERLVENVNRAMQAAVVTNDDGEPIGEYRYDGGVANRALELLGKEVGMFVERTENTNVNYAVTDQPASDDEWAAEHVTAH